MTSSWLSSVLHFPAGFQRQCRSLSFSCPGYRFGSGFNRRGFFLYHVPGLSSTPITEISVFCSTPLPSSYISLSRLSAQSQSNSSCSRNKGYRHSCLPGSCCFWRLPIVWNCNHRQGHPRHGRCHAPHRKVFQDSSLQSRRRCACLPLVQTKSNSMAFKSYWDFYWFLIFLQILTSPNHGRQAAKNGICLL